MVEALVAASRAQRRRHSRRRASNAEISSNRTPSPRQAASCDTVYGDAGTGMRDRWVYRIRLARTMWGVRRLGANDEEMDGFVSAGRVRRLR